MSKEGDPYNSNPHQKAVDDAQRAQDVLEIKMSDKDIEEANEMFAERIIGDHEPRKPAKKGADDKDKGSEWRLTA